MNFGNMSVETVVRPRVPYWGPIAGGIHEGKLIEIRGSVPYGSDVFEINLVTGVDPTSDRALHISVRFHGRIVVRNTLQRNEWGPEERTGPFPFASGRDFKMDILVEATSFRIAVDGQHCWEYFHRFPHTRVNTVFVDGSVNIERIEFVNRVSPYQIGTCIPPVGIPGTYPPGGALIPGTMPGTCIPPMPGQGIGTCVPPPGGYFPSTGIVTSSNLTPVYNPSVPYAYPIYGGLKPGMMIYLSGRPSSSAYKFTLNLQCGTSSYPPPDVAFHFDVRFFNNTVIRNTRTNNEWANEEVHMPYFPFQQGVNFDMIIRIEGDKFMVALNGQHFIEFKYRMWPLSRVDTLFIENDIVVSSIRFS